MNSLLILFTSLAVASASVVQFSPTLYTAAIPITTQYHAQDGLGQYSYGYSGGPSAKAEYKSLDGVTRGSYSYVDADGELQTVEYTADSANGFQASATNLPKAPIDDKVAPKPVEDTPEVAMAKAEHLAAVREAELRAAEDPSSDDGNGQDGQQQEQQQNGSQERESAMSQESTTAETESPNGGNGSSERGSQESGSNVNGNGNDSNGNGNGDGVSNGISSALPNNLNSASLGGLNSQLTGGFNAFTFDSTVPSSRVNGLGGLQLNGELSSNVGSSNDEIRFSEITPATTTQLRPIALPVPAASYLRVSTPTHGYSIISPSILTAVPTLRATSSQTISRTLPLSLSSKLLF